MWSSLFRLLPFEIVNAIRLLGKEITEIRIRRASYLCVTVVCCDDECVVFENCELGVYISEAMMTRIVDALTDHSLYSHENTLKQGYITVQGCYRVGIIGVCVCDGDTILHLKRVDSLCIRLWREIPGIADDIYRYLKMLSFRGSMLIYSPPGKGKTTVLRDLARSLTQRFPHHRVALIDSREEIITPQMVSLSHLDVLSGYPKAKGIEIAIRSLNPELILCDEIGIDEGKSILECQRSGVPLIATAHGDSLDELLSHGTFYELYKNRYFDVYVKIESLRSNGNASYLFTSREEISVP